MSGTGGHEGHGPNATGQPTPAPAPPVGDEGTAIAHRCPRCLHRLANQAGLPATPFGPFTAEVRCLECGETVAAGTRMFVGGTLLADDPNARGWQRRVAPGVRVLLLLALAAIVIGALQSLPAIARAVPAALGVMAAWHLLRHHALPWLAGSTHGASGQTSRSTWLVSSSQARILRLRGLRLEESGALLAPIACSAAARPVIDDEGEHGHAIDLRAAMPPAASRATCGLLIDALRLRDLKTSMRKWPDLPAPPEKKTESRGDDWEHTIRLRVEDRPVTDAAAVAMAAAMAACGATGDAPQSLRGRALKQLTPTAEAERAAAAARRATGAHICLAVTLLALLGALTLGALTLTGVPVWAGKAALVLAAVALLAFVSAGFLHDIAPDPFPDDAPPPSIMTWMALPGALCAVLESDDHRFAKATAISANTIERLGLHVRAAPQGEGTCLTLAWTDPARQDRHHPMLDLWVPLTEPEARAHAARLLQVVRNTACAGAPGEG